MTFYTKAPAVPGDNFTNPDAFANLVGLWDFRSGATHRDTGLADGIAQNGHFEGGAQAAADQLVTDGSHDYFDVSGHDAPFDLSVGSLEVQFTQSAHVGSSPDTIVNRGEICDAGHEGYFSISVTCVGAVEVTHIMPGGASTTMTTDKGFFSPGDTVNAVYSFNESTGATFTVQNLTDGTTTTLQSSQTGLTFDVGDNDDENFTFGAQEYNDGQYNEFFKGAIDYVAVYNTDDVAAPTAGTEFVDGEDFGELMELGYNDANAPTDQGGDIITNGADTIFGNGGDDTISGEGGDDLIFGDDGTGLTVLGRESFNWQGTSDAAADAGFSQNTGSVTVTYDRLKDTGHHQSSVNDHEHLNVSGIEGGGETVDSNSGLKSITNGIGNEGDFEWVFSDPVGNVEFNINDVDNAALVTVRAFDAAGNEIPVDLNGGSGVTITGNTIDSNGGDGATNSDTYNTQITIEGPVSRILVEHDQNTAGNSGITVTDIYFDVLEIDNASGIGGDDILSGDAGQDTIYGEEGDDTIAGGTGNDLLYGDSGEETTVPGAGTFTGPRESFNWDLVNQSQADSTVQQDTGDVNVTYTRTEDTGHHDSSIDNATHLNTAGIDNGAEVIDTNSSLASITNGAGNTGAFEWAFSEPVGNVEFNINDLDGGGIVSITAFGPDGTEVPLDLDLGANLRTDGDVIWNVGAYFNATNPATTVEVSIPGPVSRIEIDHTQDGNNNSQIHITDMYYDTGFVPGADVDQNGEGGDDVLIGGEGSDTMFGEGGDDTFLVASSEVGKGDVIDGGNGPDPATDTDVLDLRGAGRVTIDDASDEGDAGATKGTVTFEDGSMLTFEGIETILTDPLNGAPIANDDTITTDEDTPITFDPTANDADPNGDDLTVDSFTQPDNGTVTQNTDGTLTYTPDADYNGPDSFEVTVTDPSGETSTSTVDVTVDPVNDAPDAVNDTASTPEDTQIVLEPLDNDTDVDGDTLVISSASVPAEQGGVTFDDGTITFTPAPDFNGPATISYSVDDGNGGTDVAEIVVDVTPVNDAPEAVDDLITTDEDTPVTFDPAANDLDVDGDDLTVVAAQLVDPATGTVTVDPVTGEVTFTPAQDFNGPVEITYTVEDPDGLQDTGTATVVVGNTPDAPDAVDDTASTAEDTAVTITPLDNDTDPDGDPLRIVAASVPADEGSVTFTDDAIVFTPAEDFNGPATISYTITDDNGGTDTAEVVVDVTPVNDAPEAVDDILTTPEDTPVTFDPAANDTDPDGDDLRVVAAELVDPTLGTVTVDPVTGEVTFDPAPDFTGPVEITYTVEDPDGAQDTGTATVNVGAVNDAPDAVNDTGTTEQGTPVTIEPLTNDSDPDGDDIRVISSAIVPPAQGTVVFTDETVTFTPAPDFVGDAEITYTISDGGGLTDTATITVTVTDVIGPVDGTDAGEVMEPGYIDAEGDEIDGADGLDDTINGNGGDDTIDGGLGDDTISGGEDDDSITGGAGDDVVAGDAGSDTLAGGEGEDVLLGGAGDDDIAVGGSDAAEGGSGDDVFTLDPTDMTPEVELKIDGGSDGTDGNPDDMANGNAGDVLDLGDVADDLDVTFAPNPETGMVDGLDDSFGPDIRFEEIEKVITGSGDDAVDGADAQGPIDVETGAGDDTIEGGDGDDTIDAGGDDDVVDGGAGDDSITAGDGSDTIEGGAGADTVDAGDGDDLIDGGAGDDVIDGGDGSDTIDGGAGADAIDGGAGDDDITLGTGDEARGGSGDDDFTLAPTAEGAGDISVDGGADGTPSSGFPDDLANGNDGDTLDFTGLDNVTIVEDPVDDGTGSFSGVVSYTDDNGDVVTVKFTEIENLLGLPDPDGIVDGEEFAEDMGLGYDDANAPTDGGGDLITDGDDVIEGNGGDDTIDGAGGDDTISGGEDDDSITGGAGEDSISGDVGDDVIDGNEGMDEIDGGDGNDTIDGGDDSDVIFGDEGDDTLVGNEGEDLIVGGTGDDVIDGGANDDDLNGGEGDDTLLGGGGDDVITAGEGDDAVEGGAGADTVEAGDGNDSVSGGGGDDVIDTSGTDPATDLATPSIPPFLAGAPGDATPDDDRDTVDGGAGNDIITTGDDADSITGGTGNDTIDGGIDADTIDGGADNDSIIGGEGSDSIFGGGGDDTIYGGLDSTAPDVLNVTDDGFNSPIGPDPVLDNGDDTIDGGAGNDLIFGADDNDSITGGTGNDTIDGGVDDDTIQGGAGDDSLLGDHGDDAIQGNFGNDTLVGGRGSDTLEGNGDDDLIIGGSGDSIIGGGDSDTIIIDQNEVDSFDDADASIYVDGSGTGDDLDTLDLTGFVEFRNLVETPDSDGNSTSGSVEVLNADGEWVEVAFAEIETLLLPDPAQDGVVDGEAFGEEMGLGYDDADGPTDGGGDLITNGDDEIEGNGGDDTIDGADGNDTISGGEDDDSITGGAGDDVVAGDEGSDTLAGGEGDDTLDGGLGDDDIAVGGGDTATGGSGDDVFTVDPTDTTPDVDVTIDGGTDGTDGNPDDDANGDAGDVLDLGDVADDLEVTFAPDPETGVVDGLDGDGTPDISFDEIEKVITGAGDDTIDGRDAQGPIDVETGAGDDTIDGGDGDDTIDAGGDDDVVDGGAGDDSIVGGDGSDTIAGGEGSDTIDAGDGDDDIKVGAGDVVDGGDGDDVFEIDPDLAGDAPVTIDGGSDGTQPGDEAGPENGDDGDVLDLRGLDLVSLEFDPTDPETGTAVYTNANGDPVTISFTEIETVLTDPLPDGIVDGEEFGEVMNPLYDDADGPTDGGGDIIDGPDGLDDVIEGNGGDDSINAGQGNDTVDGGADNDTVNGQTGNDIVDGGDGDDLVTGGFGNDTVLGGDGDDELRGNIGDDSVVGGEGNDSMGGAEGDDTLEGGAGEDTLTGGSGDDVLDGGLGNDTITGSTGADSITDLDGDNLINSDNPGSFNPDLGTPIPTSGGTGPFIIAAPDADPDDNKDTITTGDGDDTINAGDDADVIDAGDGDNVIDAGTDADTVTTGDGNDSIIGGEGDDLINAGAGNDTIDAGVGSPLANFIDAPNAGFTPDPILNNGDDTINAGAGDDVVRGEDDNDLIDGGTGNDTLDGGIDDDTILGGAGDDEIVGGQGADSLDGGEGDDTFNVGTFTDPNGTGDYKEGLDDTIVGGEDPDDTDIDTLDLSGSGPLEVVFDDAIDPTGTPGESGTVIFYTDDTQTVEAGRLEFREIENVIPCFTPGAMIATPRGEVAVESLRPGDKIITRDNGIQEIAWTGSRTLDRAEMAAGDGMKPILIKAGALGRNLPERDMVISPQHKVLITGNSPQLFFEESEVLVAAKHLLGRDGVSVMDTMHTTYIHFMFESHEVILSDGAWTESFQPGDQSMGSLGEATREEIFALFPELATEKGLKDYAAARRTLKAHEAKLLPT